MRGAEAGALLLAGRTLADAAAAIGLRMSVAAAAKRPQHLGQVGVCNRRGGRTLASTRGHPQHNCCRRPASCALVSLSLLASTSG